MLDTSMNDMRTNIIKRELLIINECYTAFLGVASSNNKINTFRIGKIRQYDYITNPFSHTRSSLYNEVPLPIVIFFSPSSMKFLSLLTQRKHLCNIFPMRDI